MLDKCYLHTPQVSLREIHAFPTTPPLSVGTVLEPRDRYVQIWRRVATMKLLERLMISIQAGAAVAAVILAILSLASVTSAARTMPFVGALAFTVIITTVARARLHHT